MIVMLLWAGSYKMTTPGAEGIVPLVSNSPLISWQFKIFGTYIGSDIIGLTEWTSAILSPLPKDRLTSDQSFALDSANCGLEAECRGHIRDPDASAAVRMLGKSHFHSPPR